jgi:hypothetical protein
MYKIVHTTFRLIDDDDIISGAAKYCICKGQRSELSISKYASMTKRSEKFVYTKSKTFETYQN